MKKRENILKRSVDWFNELNGEKQSFILDCLKNNFSVRLSNYLLDEFELENYLILINCIVELIAQTADEDIIIKKLTLAGMEENKARIFYTYSIGFVAQRLDAVVINNVSIESIESCIKFIIEKMLLSREHRSFSLEYVTHICKFQNSDEMLKTLRFLYNMVYLIANRDYSLMTLRSIFEVDFEISKEVCDIFFSQVQEKLPELYQAQLSANLNKLLNKVDQFESIFNQFINKKQI